MERKVKQYICTHTELMGKWNARHKAAGYKGFVSDGIVCPEIWFSQATRILFILKEAYSGNQTIEIDWNLLDYLRSVDGSKGRIWSSIAEWQYALQNTTEEKIPIFDNWLGSPFGDFEQYRETKCSLLKKCAIINIKKSNGRNGSSDLDLFHYVKEDWDLIKAQIETISPTIIVCGSTFHLLRDWKTEREQDRKHIFEIDTANIPEDRGCYAIGSKTLIAYYHPANHYPSALNHYGLAGMYHNFLKAKDRPNS